MLEQRDRQPGRLRQTRRCRLAPERNGRREPWLRLFSIALAPWLALAANALVIQPIHENAAGEPLVQEIDAIGAAAITPQSFLGGSDGWDPEAPDSPPIAWLPGDGFWDETENWESNGEPTLRSDLRIAGGRARIRAGGEQANSLTVETDGAATGILTFESGDATVSDDAVITDGRLEVGTGTLRIHDELVLDGATVTTAPGGEVTTDGRIRLLGSVSFTGTGGSVSAGTDLIATGATVVQGAILSADGEAELFEGSLTVTAAGGIDSNLLRVGRNAQLLVESGSVSAGRRLVVAASASLDVGSGASVEADWLSNKGVAIQRGGDVRARADFVIHEGAYGLDGGNAVAEGSAQIGTVAGAVGALRVKGGTATLTDGAIVGRKAGAKGILEIDGGHVDLEGALVLGFQGGSGELRVSGGLISAEDLINGDGDDGIGRVQVNGSGASFHLTGNYSQNALSTLVAVVDGTGIGTIEIDGDVSFAPGATIEVTTAGAAPGDFVVMRWTGAATGAPSFAAGVDTRIWSMAVAYDGLTVSHTPIPVPALPPGLLALLSLLLVIATASTSGLVPAQRVAVGLRKASRIAV